ncbi:MAG: SAM-dependent methyltransferase [Desulfobacterales bacterium]|nr:SAM-dependent methyltransferase [Desulfobacterales bacterium]
MEQKEWSIGKLMELSSGYWKLSAIQAGIKLDIFTIIGEGELTAQEIAIKIESDTRATSMLLNALAALELIQKKDARYFATDFAKKFLSKNSDDYFGYIIMHFHNLVYSWNNLHEAVKSGKPVRTRMPQRTDEELENFLMGMNNLATHLAKIVTDKIDLSNCNSIIDIGGGPATYSIHFCIENKNLKATVFDLPSTEPFAKKNIEKFGLTDRINFIAGNYLEDKIEGKYDAAWLSQILHGMGQKECFNVIEKAVASLNKGGMIYIHEFILDDSMASPVHPALFSLNMLLGTDNGQSYSEGQIIDMLKNAGVENIKRLQFKGPNDSGIISGIKA